MPFRFISNNEDIIWLSVVRLTRISNSQKKNKLFIVAKPVRLKSS